MSATAFSPIKTRRPEPFDKVGNSTRSVGKLRWIPDRVRRRAQVRDDATCVASVAEEPDLADGGGEPQLAAAAGASLR